MEITKDLLEKFWSGRCTPEEHRAIEAWRRDGVPAEDYPLEAPEGENILKQQLWGRVQSGLGAGKEALPAPGRKASARRWLLPLISAAATFILVVFTYLYNTSSSPSRKEERVLQWQEISVPHRHRKHLVLPDSTVVYLNAGSTLRFPARFEGCRRHVILEGEAFFSVAPDPGKPFIVETEHTTARVLGTRFNYRSYPGESRAILAVEEGKVQFTAPGCADTLVLTAERRGTFDGKALAAGDAGSADHTAWTRGEIVFNRITLGEALKELERWYGVSIRLSNPGLSGHRVKARFQNMPLEAVLHDLAFANNLKFSVRGREVTMYQ